MRLKKLKRLSKSGYVMMLAAGLMLPGISTAAVVKGTTSQLTPEGDITVDLMVSDVTDLATITITWPDVDRWVGINFAPPFEHSDGYIIMSSRDGTNVFEANAVCCPRNLEPQDALNQDLDPGWTFSSDGSFSTLTVTRAPNTGDPDDFEFLAEPQTIGLIWALGQVGADPDVQHQFTGDFAVALRTAVIPVPAALPLLASGLFALGLLARRKKT